MKVLFITVFSLLTVVTKSQNISLPNDSGKCYNYCKLPPQLKLDTTLVINIPNHLQMIPVPANYDVVSDTIMIPVYDSTPQVRPGVYDALNKSVVITTNNGNQYHFSYTENIVLEQPDTFQLQKPPLVFVVSTYDQTGKLKFTKEKIPASYEMKIDSQQILGTKEYGNVEVLCQQYVTASFITQLKSLLALRGFNLNTGTVWTDTDEELLNQFQLTNHLPAGGFNLATLSFLGIQ